LTAAFGRYEGAVEIHHVARQLAEPQERGLAAYVELILAGFGVEANGFG
jgi:hypothetical protein